MLQNINKNIFFIILLFIFSLLITTISTSELAKPQNYHPGSREGQLLIYWHSDRSLLLVSPGSHDLSLLSHWPARSLQVGPNMFVMGHFYSLIQDNLLLLCALKIGSGKTKQKQKHIISRWNNNGRFSYEKVLAESDDDICVVWHLSNWVIFSILSYINKSNEEGVFIKLFIMRRQDRNIWGYHHLLQF